MPNMTLPTLADSFRVRPSQPGRPGYLGPPIKDTRRTTWPWPDSDQGVVPPLSWRPPEGLQEVQATGPIYQATPPLTPVVQPARPMSGGGSTYNGALSPDLQSAWERLSDADRAYLNVWPAEAREAYLLAVYGANLPGNNQWQIWYNGQLYWPLDAARAIKADVESYLSSAERAEQVRQQWLLQPLPTRPAYEYQQVRY